MILVDFSKINFNSFIEKEGNLQDHEFYELMEMISESEDIVLFDIMEGGRLSQDTGKLSRNGWHWQPYQYMTNLHMVLERFKSRIFYITGDFNFIQNYTTWFEEKNFNKKMDVLIWPFGVDATRFDELKNFYHRANKKTEKTKNFSFMVSRPQIIRLMILDKFFKHENFEYSFFPFFHLKDNSLINQKEISRNEKPHIPIRWSKDGFCIAMGDKDYIDDEKYLNETFLINELIELENGFNLFHNIKELTEFTKEPKTSSFIQHAKDKPKNFGSALPAEILASCCSIEVETYGVEESIFFTEKTWRNFSYNRPFLLFGSYNQNRVLNALGFELYTDVFNYEFDDEFVVKERFTKYCDQIEHFLNYDTDDFHEHLKIIDEKIEHNNIILNGYMKKSEPFFEFNKKHCKILDLNSFKKMELFSIEMSEKYEKISIS